MQPDVSCPLLLPAGTLTELRSSFPPPAQPDKPWLNLQLSQQETEDASRGRTHAAPRRALAWGLLLLSPVCGDALAELVPGGAGGHRKDPAGGIAASPGGAGRAGAALGRGFPRAESRANSAPPQGSG